MHQRKLFGTIKVGSDRVLEPKTRRAGAVRDELASDGIRINAGEIVILSEEGVETANPLDDEAKSFMRGLIRAKDEEFAAHSKVDA